jgi:hypothetical protein
VALAGDELEGQVVPVFLDALQEGGGDVEVAGAEQQPGRRLEPPALIGAPDQDGPGQPEVGAVEPGGGGGAGRVPELAGVQGRVGVGDHARLAAQADQPGNEARPGDQALAQHRRGQQRRVPGPPQPGQDPRGRPGPRARGAAQQQRADPRRLLQPEQQGGQPAPVVADHMGAGQAKGVQQPGRVGGEAGRAVAAARGLAPAEAAQVRHQQRVAVPEPLDDLVPAPPVLRPAVQQQHRRPGAGLGQVQPDRPGLALDVQPAVPDTGQLGQPVLAGRRPSNHHGAILASPPVPGQPGLA